MFLGRKNQYCENDYTTNCNLQIQCDPYQITNGIFHRTRTKNFSIHMETPKTPNSQSSLEKNGAGGINVPDFILHYTQRDRVEREVGGGIRMGNTCKSMANSCQCMTKTTTIL